MVRSLVGALLDVGSGKKNIDLIKKALEEPYELETFFVAPSEGLYLENIKY